jgi:hypothetical protein
MVAAAVSVVAIELAQQAQASSLPTDSAQALELTGAGRSQSYQMASRLREALGTLQQPAGRPARDQPACDRRVSVARAVTEFLMRHPVQQSFGESAAAIAIPFVDSSWNCSAPRG